ncbi:MAG: hypothetical protein JW829_14500, partial [Pirellulales bacterium]|nr:hypothetical protein [Pirellulales bacterium]
AVLDGNGNPTGYYAHQFTQAESDLLVAALKSDDHKVTIGLQYNSSHDDKFALKSKDADVSGVGPVPPILRLDVVLNSLAADFDGDDDVDGNDFLIWQSGFGVDDTGDADTDSDTDGDDLLIWKTEFGSADGAFSVVPEPTAGLLAILLFGLSAWYSRKYPARSQY